MFILAVTLLGYGDGEGEITAASYLAHHPYIAAMKFYKPLGDGEAKSHSLSSDVVVSSRLTKVLKYPWLVLKADADTIIDYRATEQMRLYQMASYLYLAFLRRKPVSVGNKVQKDLAHLGLVSKDR